MIRIRRAAPPAAALAVLLSLVTGPVAASSAPRIRPLSLSAADVAALAHSYAAERHLPSASVGAVRPGSLHAAEDPATGRRWAVADFRPAATVSPTDAIAFQDGAGKALYTSTTESGDTWHFAGSVQQATCGTGNAAGGRPAVALPAAAIALLDPAGTARASCTAGSARPTAAQRAAASAAATTPDSSPYGSAIAGIALGQVGLATTPAVGSFGGVDCDPYSTLVGAASPNADGCGADPAHAVADENEEWCSDFAKWSWEQAGVATDFDTVTAAAGSWYAWAVGQGRSPAADSGTPAVGDAVVFYGAGAITTGTPADHVGLISAVHADGTVDMVNGDFLGSNGITVQYNQNLSLTSWAAATWGSGEQWVLIAPPGTTQSPAPSASISAPATAAAGTAVSFTAVASQTGGSISGYAWTFGDGRNSDSTGATASHVFTEAGPHTVTMTATSNLGTAATATWTVDVGAAGSAGSADPNTSVWYTTSPVMRYLFTETSGNALAVDSWDGARWLQQTEPGALAAGSGLTSLTYADPAVSDATVPHAFYRTSAGTLGQTRPGANGWTSTTAAGTPGASSAIAGIAGTPRSALTVSPSVFYFDPAGDLAVATETGGTWSAAAIPGATTATPRSLTTVPYDSADYAFYLTPSGAIAGVTDAGGTWATLPVPDSLGITAGTSLAATTDGASIDLFFVDAAGHLADATLLGSGSWVTREIAGTPAATSNLVATNTLTSAGAVVDEVFYRTAGGSPAVSWWTGSAWGTAGLPGTATVITAASGDAIPSTGQQVFFANGATLTVDAATAPGAAWTATALPSTPTVYPGTVLLYAATSADRTTALDAAAYGGLPSSQVTTSFATAWAAALSGDYLVIAVGQAAETALYDNPCGWANPSQDDPGSTPFNYVIRPLNVPLTNLFLVGTAATSSKTPTRTDDLAYYAVHGALPSGAVLPTIAGPGHTCLGSPS